MKKIFVILLFPTMILLGCDGQPNPEDLAADASSWPVYVKIGTGWLRFDQVMGPQFVLSDDAFDRYIYRVVRDKQNLYGFINDEGKIVLPARYDNVMGYSENIAAVKKDGEWRFIDKRGESIIDKSFASVREFHDGRAWTSDGFIDIAGKIVIGEPYSLLANDFSDGRSRISDKGLYGFMDVDGNVVIKPQFSNAGDFKEGMAWVYVDGKYGYIDKSGSMIIEPQFDFAWDFEFGQARVMIGNDSFCIDKQGRESSGRSEDNYHFVEKNN